MRVYLFIGEYPQNVEVSTNNCHESSCVLCVILGYLIFKLRLLFILFKLYIVKNTSTAVTSVFIFLKTVTLSSSVPLYG